MAGIQENLELNISEALKSIKILDAALTNSAKQFKAQLQDATATLNNVKVSFNTQSIKEGFDKAAASGAATLKPKIDTAALNEQLNLFSKTQPKFEQLKLDVDTKPAQNSLNQIPPVVEDVTNKATTNFNKIASQATQTGTQLTLGLTLPITAIGTAAVKTGNEFEVAFARMVGLANVPASEVENLRQGVLSLGGTTTKSPNELADALYFINSSGIAAKDSLVILEKGAKAAAAGLGSTKDVVDVTTSVLNAYGKENITAAQATDILVQAVRDGKGEPTAFAQVLGRVVPTAAKLGVEFDQVAAALAVMTRTGLSASEASVSLNQVFNSFLNTTKEGERVLQANGLSLSFIREELAKPQGLINVMRLLDQTFGGNLETLDKVIPNIRALRGFLNILAQDAGLVNQVFQNTNDQLKNTNDQLGATEEAFNAYAATTAAKVNEAKVAVESALIGIGAALAPLVENLSTFITAIVEMFQSMSSGQQTAILVIAGVVAALGPLLLITGALINSVKTIISIGPALLSVFTNPIFLTAVVVLGALAAAFVINAKAALDAKRRVQEYTNAIRETGEVASGVQKVLEGMFEAGKNRPLLEALDEADVTLADFSAAVEAGGTTLDTMKAKLVEAFAAKNIDEETRKNIENFSHLTLEEFIKKLIEGKETFELFNGVSPTTGVTEAAGDLQRLIGAIDQTGSDVAKASKEAELFERVMGKTKDTTKETTDVISTLPPELQKIIRNAEGATVSADDLSAALDTLGKGVPNVANAIAEGGAAILKSLGGATGAFAELTKEQKDNEKASTSGAKATASASDAAEKAEKANQKYEDSLLDVEKAQRRLIEAQNELNELLLGPKPEDKEAARIAAGDAALDVVAAQVKVTEAEKKLKAVLKPTVDPLDLQEANLTLKKAEEDRAKIIKDATSTALERQQAELKVAKAREALNKVQATGTSSPEDKAEAQLELARAENDLAKATLGNAKAQKELNDINTFDPTKDKEVLEGKQKVKDAETDLQRQLRESQEAYDAITQSVEKVNVTEAGRATAIKEKYIPTIEELTKKMAESFTNNLSFFSNVKTLVERGADDLAGAIVEVAKTDKDAAAALAAQAVTLTDDRLAEQERLVEDTAAKNAKLVEDSKKLYEGLISKAKEETPAVREAIQAAFPNVGEEAFFTKGEDLGKDFMHGIVAGLNKGIEDVKEAGRKAAQAVIDEARKQADANSPSREMITLGTDMADGLAVGLRQERARVADAARLLVGSALSAVSGSGADLLPAGGDVLRSLFDRNRSVGDTTTFGDTIVTIPVDVSGAIPLDQAEKFGETIGDAASTVFVRRGLQINSRMGVKR